LALIEWSKPKFGNLFYHSNRAPLCASRAMEFNRELAGCDARISVISFETTDYNHKNWWKTEQGQHALLKFAYYDI
jgi:hypothetical protein